MAETAAPLVRRFAVLTMRQGDEKASDSRYSTFDLAMEHAARCVKSERYEWVTVCELTSRPVFRWELANPGAARLG